MPDRTIRPADVDAEVRNILGDRASDWMHTPSRLFDNMAPADLASSPEGAYVVLRELRKPGVIHTLKTIAQRQS